MMRNKYRGICDCGARVDAGDGFYNQGQIYCEEPIEKASRYGCPTSVERDWLQEQKRYAYSKGQNDRSFVSEWADVNERIAGFWAMIDARNADPEYQAQQKAIADKRAKQEAGWAKQGLRRCPRCGGAGRSDRWIATGSVCYQCEGHGAILA